VRWAARAARFCRPTYRRQLHIPQRRIGASDRLGRRSKFTIDARSSSRFFMITARIIQLLILSTVALRLIALRNEAVRSAIVDSVDICLRN
jgi:hypothetical protein